MIKLSDTDLPKRYRKFAEVTFALQMGQWITIAHFMSETHGAVPAFFLRKHGGSGKVREISQTVYYRLLSRYTFGRVIDGTILDELTKAFEGEKKYRETARYLERLLDRETARNAELEARLRVINDASTNWVKKFAPDVKKG